MDKAIFLSEKMEFLRMIASVTMLWWVSSTVFCAGIFGAIWNQRIAVYDSGFRDSIRKYLSFFFATTVIYGAWTMTIVALLYLWPVRSFSAGLGLPQPNFLLEFLGVFVAVGIGTTSFYIFFRAWKSLWEHWELNPPRGSKAWEELSSETEQN